MKRLSLATFIFLTALVALSFTTHAQQTPYLGTAFTIPGTIQAEDYDNGGEGVAYHDHDVDNSGGGYRNDDVDIQASADTSGGYLVGWVRSGEWLEYTVNVSAAGTFTIEARVACDASGATFHIEFDGTDKTGVMTIPNTGNNQSWTTISKTGVALSAGQQILRIAFDNESASGWGGNLSYIHLSSESSTTPPTITSHPANQTVTVGQTATFTVSATGTAPLSYQWQKNNANISGATNVSYITPATTSGDSGSTFRCVVSNSAGTATSDMAILSVRSNPPSTLGTFKYFDSNGNPVPSNVYQSSGDGSDFLHIITSLDKVNTEAIRLENDGLNPNGVYISFFSGESSEEARITGGNKVGNGLAFTANGSERMRIDGSGNVGIGTVTPSSTLDVNGTIKATEIIVALNGSEPQTTVDKNDQRKKGKEKVLKGTADTTATNSSDQAKRGWPDFVFANDYNLMKLDELAQTIKDEKRLPGIPSAKEVASQGINVGEMQARLLQKIEELTLYVIDLKKENEAIRTKVMKLERR